MYIVVGSVVHMVARQARPGGDIGRSDVDRPSDWELGLSPQVFCADHGAHARDIYATPHRSVTSKVRKVIRSSGLCFAKLHDG
eukprot:1968352-Pyramimonas_sp.AAC.1